MTVNMSLLRMKNIDVTIKILIVILCNDTMVTLRPTDECRAVCSNTHIQKSRLHCSFPVLCLPFEMFLSPLLYGCLLFLIIDSAPVLSNPPPFSFS